MGYVYLDTSSLIRRAELSGVNPTARCQHAGAPVVELLRSTPSQVATSEVGVLEFHDVATWMWRDTNPPNTDYGEEWWNVAVDTTMTDISNGRLLVLPQPPRLFEQAMVLVTMATRQHGRKFRVWDAAHLITAITWSMSVGAVVELWTTDTDFAGFTGLFPHFATRVSVRNLDD